MLRVYLLKINEISDKRKKIVANIEEKLPAIKQLRSRVMAKTIALGIRFGKSTIGDKKKNRAEIEKWYAA